MSADNMGVFKGLRFGARLGLLLFLSVILTLAFWMSVSKLRHQQSDVRGTGVKRRRILDHPLILQPPLIRPSLSETSKKMAEKLISMYSVNLGSDGVSRTGDRSLWEMAASWVKEREILPDTPPELGTVLHAMATSPIVNADFGYKGTQLKLSLVLEGGQRVAFKPRWYARDFIILGKAYAGADRHNGEIASFHLNRILGFRRAPLVVGRKVNLKTEIMPVSTGKLLKTFFTRDNNTCFYGRCYYCKGEEDGVCADGHVLEGIIVLWLPSSVKLKNHQHPWARTYKDGVKARWEKDGHYCKFVQNLWPYRDLSDEFLDVMDASVFDYLIGNADRHNYETMNDSSSKRGMMTLIDSGKSFGNPFFDERSILAPILQCCKLRRTTYDRLHLLKDGVLGDVMKEVLSRDPLQPILFEPHYDALNRRLATILEILNDCSIANNGLDNVLVGEAKP